MHIPSSANVLLFSLFILGVIWMIVGSYAMITGWPHHLPLIPRKFVRAVATMLYFACGIICFGTAHFLKYGWAWPA